MNLQRFQASNSKYNIQNVFTLLYKETCWKKFSCAILVLYMCTLEQLKGSLNYHYSFMLKP